MLKRSWPRLMTFSSIANGNSFTVTLSILPVKNASSSCSVPRATVPSTSGRALEPSEKNALDRKPRYFGWLCMSWRQPVITTREKAEGRRQRAFTQRAGRRRSASRIPDPASRLLGDIVHLRGAEILEERARPGVIELRIDRLDREEEAVLARVRGEPFDVEHGVIRHRKAVQPEHPQDRGERGEENRQLERHRDEHRPAQIRAAFDVQWNRDRRDPRLQSEPR